MVAVPILTCGSGPGMGPGGCIRIGLYIVLIARSSCMIAVSIVAFVPKAGFPRLKLFIYLGGEAWWKFGLNRSLIPCVACCCILFWPKVPIGSVCMSKG